MTDAELDNIEAAARTQPPGMEGMISVRVSDTLRLVAEVRRLRQELKEVKDYIEHVEYQKFEKWE